MDVATGERRRVLPAAGVEAASRSLRATTQFLARRQGPLPDDRSRRRIPQLAFLDLATGKLDYFGEGGNWDVESIALSPDGRTLAVITNEAGIGVLRLYDAATRKRAAAPARADRQRARPRVARELARSRGLGQQRAKPERRLRDRRARQRRHALDRDARRRTRRWRVSQRRADRMEELRRPGDRRLHHSPAGEIHRQAAGHRVDPRRTGRPGATRASWVAGITSSTSSASPSSSRTCAARPATARRSSRSTTG